MKRLFRWSLRALLGVVVVVIGLVIAGVIYESIAQTLDRRAFPPPGRMVRVDGFRLHLYCLGKGSPTVLIEVGAGSRSLDWLDVQKRAADVTRVCTYDRAGFGWSDPGPRPRDVKEIGGELDHLIASGGLPRPLVLVGHSFGGLIVRMFAYEHPTEVAGMVLVDAAEENMDAQLPLISNSWNSFRRVVIVNESLAKFGVVRLALRLRPSI